MLICRWQTDARMASLSQSTIRFYMHTQKIYPRTVLNVLRMIKLFAWERKVEEQIRKKRDGREFKHSLKNR